MKHPTDRISGLCWNRDCHKLTLDGVVVKHFRQPAKNQELILAAFQEEGWPERIDNPLSGDADTSADDRLHTAVKRLNYQRVRKVRFLCDGAGKGIVCELIQ